MRTKGWICIDKSPSAELSEPINSMLNWYRDSAVCYAYLVELSKDMTAPPKPRFFDEHWNDIGNKARPADKLEHITGVGATIQDGGNLKSISVARKMSWAPRRHTTRTEDQAYCLLGLFDVSMPMLYGEGSKAFIRLQEEIIRLLAPSPAEVHDTSNVVRCNTGFRKTSEPINVTSRGQWTAGPAVKILMPLYCKDVDCDMCPPERVGIIVIEARNFEGQMYTRC
ncbi:hypothetical protein MKZ38_005234 [Zalerion maritima]|uniref:Uncharacterized protein n=1 Tax=Zalerion maritima TaxID=339359 RepID=A0AAD5RL06_9PEZI|nr:hypothetical protein MKZ38_005234 [Zalerion maritima]